MSPEDEQEFRDFVAARSPTLLRTAYFLTGDPDRAQDLLQTALLAGAQRYSPRRRTAPPAAITRPIRCCATG